MSDPSLAFEQREQARAAVEVRINFGLFAGREATPAEIDALAHALSAEVPAFSIVSEQRHEFENEVEAAVHQVVITVDDRSAETESLRARIVAAAEAWAEACITDRRVEIADDLLPSARLPR